ncbi:ATP-binding cassette protein subfamily G, member 5 [Trypanosoma rangeli]|uniref:ATP-binding cassette protein subfamily G, member 5 n=1 Tax=Trypanosoma rangeli TaxID=5698 RepID=A0A422NW91_TRYRA|nr:ATP-binding cassette protein subfamily G, member 5 [Trypanosoma rangeli]RNF09696.1 ATP-binding cassette protein subfamily G, member 5 [Trypanosoma rangeli]|eukprot:RNF09696.1 ATP-binding cassette protein subfamily G, member 5 [Trypanosoma rangeli]
MAAWLVALVTLPRGVQGEGARQMPRDFPFSMSQENFWMLVPGADRRGIDARYGVNVAAVEDANDTCKNGGTMNAGDCECPEPNMFDGLRCEMCQSGAACAAYVGEPHMCHRGLAVRGSNKQFECSLDSPFLAVLGGGRKVEAVVTLNFSTEDATAFAAGSDGVCDITLFRVEPNHELVDAFFRCTTSQCSMRLVAEGKSEAESNSASLRRTFKVLTLVGQVVLVTLCTLVALLRCVSSKLGYRRTAKIVVGLGAALTLATVLFITVLLVCMRSKEPDIFAVYECKSTDCHCAEDPPSKYTPICSRSLIHDKILPLIKNSVHYSCNLRTRHCQLTLADIALVFDLQCNASECVNTKQFPTEPTMAQPEILQAQRSLLILLILAVMVVVVTIAAHAVRLAAVSRQKAAEFVRIFGLSEPMSETVRPMDDDVINGNSNGTAVNTLRHQARSLKGEAVEEVDDAFGCDEVLGLAFHGRSGVSHATSGARRCFVAKPGEVDRIEFFRYLTKSPFELQLKDLAYTLPGSRLAAEEEAQARPILHRVNFTVHSGEVLAILGPSGAGKTTLLDLLSVRRKQGVTTGTISFNGTPITTAGAKFIKQYRNIIGYVSQEDTLLPALTVRQTIEYAARLKLPQAFSNTTIKSIVRHMIEALKLQQCEHTVIGDGSGLRGVSGGEKRRVSIAVELLANPRILFLDEPTSGLDAVSAKRVVESVVELAKESPMRAYAPHYFAFKPLVIFSIHQPSQEIFELFDKLLLLSRGVSVYCGPARTAAATLEKRLKHIMGDERPIPSLEEHPNHAEYLMKLDEILGDTTRMEVQAAGAGVAPELMLHEGTEFFQQSREYPGENGASESEPLVVGEDILRTTSAFRVYYSNVYQQLTLLTSRAACCLISSFHLLVCHAAVTACVGVLMMVLYHEQALDLPGALNRAGSITFMLLVVSFVSLSCLEQLVAERKLFVLERENGFYQTLPYLLSKILIDIIPLRVVPAMVLASLIYFPMGLRVDNGVHFFWFVVIVVLFSICITLVVLCIGIVTGSFGSAALLSSVVILWNFVFGGFLVQSETVPVALRPFQTVSPFFLAFEALLVNELDGQACTFSPTDETGKQVATSIPIMCVQYLSNIGLKPTRFNGDVGLLAGFIFVLLVIAWLLLARFTTIVR